MKVFRGCRYEVRTRLPSDPVTRLWSRHRSYDQALLSFRSLMAGGVTRGEIAAGSFVELRDVGVDGNRISTIERREANR